MITNMQTGTLAKKTGGIEEKRVITFAAHHFDVSVDKVLVQPLTPDASTRKYFRVANAEKPEETFIISLYPSPFNAHDNSFIDVTNLFEASGIPVPKIIKTADTEGIILQEDLGDISLNFWLHGAEAAGDRAGCESMLHRAVDLITKIQAVTQTAYEKNSISSTLAFDFDKLSWELNYFYDHYFGSYLRNELNSDNDPVKRDLNSIAEDLAARPRELTHRDYHGMNLMVDQKGELRLIDHQDARMGPISYDLVPLLVERRLEPVSDVDDAKLNSIQEYFIESRRQVGLPHVSYDEFRHEFNLMAVQRQLKATGTFSYQTAVVGRGEAYECYIKPTVKTVLRYLNLIDKDYPALKNALEKSLS